MRRLTALLCTPVLLGAVLLSAACDSRDSGPGAGARADRPKASVAPGPHDVAVLTIQGMGEIRIDLYPEFAPKTVANFEKLAGQGFYNGTQFHRVIPGFMLQGGDPNSKQQDPRHWGRGGPGYAIDDEFTDFPHERGVLSMANTGRPKTGGSQFFILHGDAPHLNGKHAAFGKVVAGMEVVDAIAEMEIDTYGRYGQKDRPYPKGAVVERVVIEKAGE